MVKYIATFGLKPGYDPDESWKIWQEVHVPVVVEWLKGLITKYTTFRLRNVDASPELFGGIELCYKDVESAEKGIKKMLHFNPDAMDKFTERVTNLRRVLIVEEKVAYQEKPG
jgi:hypothetical protein